MSLLTTFYEFLISLAPALFLLGLLITGCLILASQEWRVGVLALLVQYGLAGSLLAKSGALPAAGAKMLTGVVACWILYVSTRAAPLPTQHGKDRLFRLLAAGVIAVGAYGAARQDFPVGVSSDLLMAAGWLVAIGLLIVALARNPLRVALGLLTFQMGVEIVYAAVERSLVVLGLLAAVNWAVALAAGLLLVSQSVPETARASAASLISASSSTYQGENAGLPGQGLSPGHDGPATNHRTDPAKGDEPPGEAPLAGNLLSKGRDGGEEGGGE